MKRYFIYATTALLMMGCMDERPLVDPSSLAYDPSKVICITTTTGTMQNAEMTTRGTPINDVADMTDFGAFCYKGTNVWGSGQEPNKMYNRKLTRNASGAWEYATGTPVPWDDTTGDNLYSFFAYAPFGTGTAPTGNGIIVTSTKTDVGIPTLSYTVPTDVTNQPDLMIAEPRYDLARQYNAVAMKMNHALTCIGFNLAGNGEKVVDIAIEGVSMTGKLAMNGTAPITWTDLGPVNTTTSFAASLNYDDDDSGGKKTYYTATTTMSSNLIAGNGYLMMIPQTLTADAKVIITYDDGTSIDFSLDAHTWLPGKKIIYEITIVPGGTIVVTPEHLVLPYTGVNHITDNIKVECFDNDGNPAPTMAWTLTSVNPDWFTLTLNADGSDPQTTVSGTGTTIVYTAATPNPSNTDNRTTSVTLNSTVTDVVKVTQLHEETVPGGGTVLDNFYIGAFWRAGETGERILRHNGTNTGEWVVTVAWMDSNWEVGDIILATGESADDDIDFTDPAATPGNAESFQVEGDQTAIGNVGEIIFRVGLKTTWTATAAAPARYAVLILSYGTNYDTHQKIFLRQGHEADYVMQNGDPATSIATGWDGTRNKCMKFSPYNLTHPAIKSGTSTGGTTIASHPVVPARSSLTANDAPDYFTEYPTQAGAFFQWAASSIAQRRAYHPTVPKNDNIDAWLSTVPDTFWASLSGDNETCPPGWRRPNDGSTTAEVGTTNNIAGSEIRQSLWLNPQNSLAANANNSVWGYYADGYFDRRAIVNSANSVTGSAVSADSSIPAYRGRLFFNPTTNASLFLPAAGTRSTTGTLTNTGLSGFYWPSSAYSTTQSWSLYVESSYASMSNADRAYAKTIRCVQESILPDVTLEPYDPVETDLK